jgi:alpha-galactosidase
MKKLLISLIFSPIACLLTAQQTEVKNNQISVINNGHIERLITYNAKNKSISSSSMRLLPSGTEFLNPGSEEFCFELDGKPYTGLNNWDILSVKTVSDDFQGAGSLIKLQNDDADISIELTYLTYPGLPVVRKKIAFTNIGAEEVKITNLDIERINLKDSQTGVHCWVMHDYARQKSLGQFISNWYDPVVVVHQADKRRGIVLGNEAPGVMKRTTAFRQPQLLSIGLTHTSQMYAFAKYLKPAEKWESTWIFTECMTIPTIHPKPLMELLTILFENISVQELLKSKKNLFLYIIPGNLFVTTSTILLYTN